MFTEGMLNNLTPNVTQMYTADRNYWSDIYGWNTQANMNYLDNLVRTLMSAEQAGTARDVANIDGEWVYDTADLTSGRNLEGTKYVADTNYGIADLTSGRDLEGTKYGWDKQYDIADLTSGRNLEGTKYGWDSQKDIANINQTQHYLAQDRFNQVFPMVQGIIGDFSLDKIQMPSFQSFGGFGSPKITNPNTGQSGVKGNAPLAKLYNKGGYVNGPDMGRSGPHSDVVKALLTPGEFVMTREAVDMIGPEKLQRMNQVAKFNQGGMVSSPLYKPIPGQTGNPNYNSGILPTSGGYQLAPGTVGGSYQTGSYKQPYSIFNPPPPVVDDGRVQVSRQAPNGRMPMAPDGRVNPYSTGGRMPMDVGANPYPIYKPGMPLADSQPFGDIGTARRNGMTGPMDVGANPYPISNGHSTGIPFGNDTPLPPRSRAGVPNPDPAGFQGFTLGNDLLVDPSATGNPTYKPAVQQMMDRTGWTPSGQGSIRDMMARQVQPGPKPMGADSPEIAQQAQQQGMFGSPQYAQPGPMITDFQKEGMINRALGNNASIYNSLLNGLQDQFASRGLSGASGAMAGAQAKAALARGMADTQALTNIPLESQKLNANYWLDVMNTNNQTRLNDINAMNSYYNSQANFLGPILGMIGGLI